MVDACWVGTVGEGLLLDREGAASMRDAASLRDDAAQNTGKSFRAAIRIPSGRFVSRMMVFRSLSFSRLMSGRVTEMLTFGFLTSAITMAGPCEPGDALGVIAGDFAVVGDDLDTVAADVVERLQQWFDIAVCGPLQATALLDGFDSPGLAASVERDLANLPTINERDRRRFQRLFEDGPAAPVRLVADEAGNPGSRIVPGRWRAGPGPSGATCRPARRRAPRSDCPCPHTGCAAGSRPRRSPPSARA